MRLESLRVYDFLVRYGVNWFRSIVLFSRLVLTFYLVRPFLYYLAPARYKWIEILSRYGSSHFRIFWFDRCKRFLIGWIVPLAARVIRRIIIENIFFFKSPEVIKYAQDDHIDDSWHDILKDYPKLYGKLVFAFCLIDVNLLELITIEIWLAIHHNPPYHLVSSTNISTRLQ